MRILIYGAGVIGCLYANLFSEAGYDTTVYARGKRLELFQEKGLLYFKEGHTWKANVKIIDKVERKDIYDFVFLTVKENQVHEALQELKNNDSPNIVTMVNTLESYEDWEKICGKGRILPAFPGAGGSFENNILHAALTPWIIQPTTIGEIRGNETLRLQQLKAVLKQSHIPYQIVEDMQQWQLCHLAMVVPIADAYYEAVCPEKAGYERKLMMKTAKKMKRNFCTLYRLGVKLSPRKMHLFRLLPTIFLYIGLTLIFRSEFANTFMYKHSVNAPDEMRDLHIKFYRYLKNKIS